MGMGRKRHTGEQIIAKLREAEVELAKGQPLAEVVRSLEIAFVPPGRLPGPYWRGEPVVCQNSADPKRQ